MPIEYVPLLEIQRDLYRLPRGMDRFRQYLRTLIVESGDDLALPPLVAMNPMAREPVADLVDAYLSANAEEVGRRVVEELSTPMSAIAGDYKIGLVLIDDRAGGWTNRHVFEYGFRLGGSVRDNEKVRWRDQWLSAALWSSEVASLESVRRAVAIPIWRAAYRAQKGPARTLRQLLAQEGECLVRAGVDMPDWHPDELEYTRQVIQPVLDADDMASAVACLFGDRAADSLGFRKMGLSENAGLALALHDASRPAR